MAPRAKVYALFNPSSGRGTGLRRVPSYLSLLRARIGSVDHGCSQYAGHERELLDRALAEGYQTIVAVGGDGTWSAATDRVIHSGRTDVALALLPAGTGNDFGKSCGIRTSSIRAVVDAIAARHTRKVDAGRANDRYFLNVVGMGFDIAVIDDAAGTRLLRGDLVYRVSALKQLFRYRGRHVEVTAGAGNAMRREYLMLVFANGKYFGGSFHIAPDARIDDGKLDAVGILDAGPLRRARLFARVVSGTHATMNGVETATGTAFDVRTVDDGPLRYEIDGDVFESPDGRLHIEAMPAALSLCVPEGVAANAG